jgi:hypothetical protein
VRPTDGCQPAPFRLRLAGCNVPGTAMKNDLLVAYRFLSNNWRQVQASTMCGCCNCLQTFAPDDVVAWTGLSFDDVDNEDAMNKQTAVCPHCGSESVLGNGSGFSVGPEFLLQMNEAWFQRTIIRRPTPKA